MAEHINWVSELPSRALPTATDSMGTRIQRLERPATNSAATVINEGVPGGARMFSLSNCVVIWLLVSSIIKVTTIPKDTYNLRGYLDMFFLTVSRFLYHTLLQVGLVFRPYSFPPRKLCQLDWGMLECRAMVVPKCCWFAEILMVLITKDQCVSSANVFSKIKPKYSEITNTNSG